MTYETKELIVNGFPLNVKIEWYGGRNDLMIYAKNNTLLQVKTRGEFTERQPRPKENGTFNTGFLHDEKGLVVVNES